MERVKLNQIRMAQLFRIKDGDTDPSAVLGSNYGDCAIMFGYLKDELLIDKYGNSYLICDKLNNNPKKFGYEFIGGKKPKKGEVFADLMNAPFLKSIGCYTEANIKNLIDPLRSVSTDNIGDLLDYIEKQYFERKQNLPDRESVLKKIKSYNEKNII